MKIDPLDQGILVIDVARRLKQTREAMEGEPKQGAFAEGANLSRTQYSNFENAGRLMPAVAAINICNRYGVTMDWLYRGDISSLPERIINKIRENEKKPLKKD